MMAPRNSALAAGLWLHLSATVWQSFSNPCRGVQGSHAAALTVSYLTHIWGQVAY